MLRVNHAILHVCDFESCVNVFSEEELDLSDRKVKSYVARRAEKRFRAWKIAVANSSPTRRLRRGARLFRQSVDSLSLSRQCAQFIAEELGHMESPESCDVLVADFEDDAPRFS